MAEEANLVVSFGVPAATFILGFLTSRFTLSKKEALDQRHRFFENERGLSDRQQVAYNEFRGALQQYIDAPTPSIDLFSAISNTGDNYFRKLREIGEAVLSGNVSEAAARDNFVPILKEAINISLPAYYKALKEIASKNGVKYSGTLRRENYEPIFAAVEKFA